MEQFVIIPKKEERLMGYEPLVYVAIRRDADANLVAFPSLSTLSKRCKLSKSTIIKLIDVLTEKGYVKVLNKGTRKQKYQLNNDKHFEPFSYDFLDRDDLSKCEKIQILNLQQFMFKDDSMLTGTVSYNNSQLEKLTGIDRHTIAKTNKTLANKGIVEEHTLLTRDVESGIANKNTIYHLDKISQAIVFKIKEQENHLRTHDEQIAALQRQVDGLVKTLEIAQRENLSLKERLSTKADKIEF